jgi:hypothetical protein
MKKITLADQIGNVSPLMAATAITVYMLSFFAALVLAPQRSAVDAQSPLRRMFAGVTSWLHELFTSPASADRSSFPVPASQ